MLLWQLSSLKNNYHVMNMPNSFVYFCKCDIFDIPQIFEEGCTMF